MQEVVRGNGCVFLVILGSVAVVGGRLRVCGKVLRCGGCGGR